jgi:hypothetical protein
MVLARGVRQWAAPSLVVIPKGRRAVMRTGRLMAAMGPDRVKTLDRNDNEQFHCSIGSGFESSVRASRARWIILSSCKLAFAFSHSLAGRAFADVPPQGAQWRDRAQGSRSRPCCHRANADVRPGAAVAAQMTAKGGERTFEPVKALTAVDPMPTFPVKYPARPSWGDEQCLRPRSRRTCLWL